MATSRKSCIALMIAGVIFTPIFFLYVGYSIANSFLPARAPFPDRGVVVDMSILNYTWYNTHNITIEFGGGLGNQLFQYASLYGISKANGHRPLITPHNRLQDVFPNLKARIVPDDHRLLAYNKYIESNPTIFDGRTFSLNFMKNLKLNGFFQSFRYFDHIRSDIKKQFAFRFSTLTKIDKVLRQALEQYKLKVKTYDEKPVTFVGMHVRRGDMDDVYNRAKGYTVASKEYLVKSMRFFEQSYKNVIFVVCSDDQKWTQENVDAHSSSSMVVFSPFQANHPGLDLCLLARCNHTIMTVGTFGWWGGWLAGGEVTYYKDFPKPQSEISQGFKHTDFYPQHWIPV